MVSCPGKSEWRHGLRSQNPKCKYSAAKLNGLAHFCAGALSSSDIAAQLRMREPEMLIARRGRALLQGEFLKPTCRASLLALAFLQMQTSAEEQLYFGNDDGLAFRL